MQPFAQPQGGGFFKPADHDGHLVLFVKVHETHKRYDQLRAKDIDEAVVDVVDLDGDGPLIERVNVGHAGIVGRLSPTGMTLGRIGTAPTAKGPMWTLLPFAEGTDDRLAQAWLTARTSGAVTVSAQPATATAAATPASNAGGQVTPEIAALLRKLGGDAS